MNLGGLLYRVEPLVCEDYINKRPVIVPYHRGGKRIHVGVQVGCVPFELTALGACLYIYSTGFCLVFT